MPPQPAPRRSARLKARDQARRQAPIQPDVQSPPNQPFRFLDLPPELRVMVYKAHINNHLSDGHRIPTDHNGRGRSCRRWTQLTKIILVNKQIYNEVTPEIYDRVTFTADDSCWLRLNNMRLCHPEACVSIIFKVPEYRKSRTLEARFARTILPSALSGRMPSRRFSIVDPYAQDQPLRDVTVIRDEGRYRTYAEAFRAAVQFPNAKVRAWRIKGPVMEHGLRMFVVDWEGIAVIGIFGSAAYLGPLWEGMPRLVGRKDVLENHIEQLKAQVASAKPVR